MKKIRMNLSYYILLAENVLLFTIAVVLILLSILLLFSSIIYMWKYAINAPHSDTGIEILTSVLLVMMIMEIVNTVTISIKSHTLDAEPFLIVGAIAAIRRTLGITVESSQIGFNNTSAFRSLLMELGVLGFLIIAIAFSVFLLRRSSSFVHKASIEDDKDH